MGAFCPMVVHLPSEKSILPYFSGPRGVAISVPFPEVRNRKGAESGLGLDTFRAGENIWRFLNISHSASGAQPVLDNRSKKRAASIAGPQLTFKMLRLSTFIDIFPSYLLYVDVDFGDTQFRCLR